MLKIVISYLIDNKLIIIISKQLLVLASQI